MASHPRCVVRSCGQVPGDVPADHLARCGAGVAQAAASSMHICKDRLDSPRVRNSREKKLLDTHFEKMLKMFCVFCLKEKTGDLVGQKNHKRPSPADRHMRIHARWRRNRVHRRCRLLAKKYKCKGELNLTEGSMTVSTTKGSWAGEDGRHGRWSEPPRGKFASEGHGFKVGGTQPGSHISIPSLFVARFF